jgi:endonuclease G
MATARSKVVIHHVYAAGINGDTGLADWLSYRLTKDAVGVASLLPRTWNPDRLLRFSGVDDILGIGSSELRLAEIAVSNSPYGGAGEILEQEERTARLAPMTAFANTPYWSDLNNLSNMVPMPKSLRIGPWLHLEQQLNRLVARKGELQVITGPVFLIDNLSASPTTTTIEPAAYYKVVASQDDVEAFVFSKELKQFDSYCDQVTDLKQLQRMLSIKFFPDRSLSQSDQLLAELNCTE